MLNFPNKEDLFFIEEFNHFAFQYIETTFSQKTAPQARLKEAVAYTLLAKTKRFRPLLSIYVAKALGLNYKSVLPWALSVEMIHNFSLIHDDLPCMDNDDLRRGKPSNHKVFGEALALLSGNSLLVEAFSVLTKYFSSAGAQGLEMRGLKPFDLKSPTIKSSNLCVSLITEIINATGSSAMMLGQVGDLVLDKKIPNDKKDNSFPSMPRKTCNELKTGALIKASVCGVVSIYKKAKEGEEKIESQAEQKLLNFSMYLGRAFQWADDLVDKQGDKAFVKKQLKEDSEKALQCLQGLSGDTQYLQHLIMANQTHFQ